MNIVSIDRPAPVIRKRLGVPIILSAFFVAACAVLPWLTGSEAAFQAARTAEVSSTYGVAVLSHDQWLTSMVIDRNGAREVCVFPSEKAVRTGAALNCSPVAHG